MAKCIMENETHYWTMMMMMMFIIISWDLQEWSVNLLGLEIELYKERENMPLKAKKADQKWTPYKLVNFS